MLLGGEVFVIMCYVWWNFVSFLCEWINQVKDDWKNQCFFKVFGDDKEFILIFEVLKIVSYF